MEGTFRRIWTSQRKKKKTYTKSIRAASNKNRIEFTSTRGRLWPRGPRSLRARASQFEMVERARPPSVSQTSAYYLQKPHRETTPITFYAFESTIIITHRI